MPRHNKILKKVKNKKRHKRQSTQTPEDSEEIHEEGTRSSRSISVDRDIENAVIKLKSLDAVLKQLTLNLSFVSTLLLITALDTLLSSAWIKFSAVSLASFVVAVLPRCFERVGEIKRELQLEHGKESNTLLEKFEDVLGMTLSIAMSFTWREVAQAMFGLLHLSQSGELVVTLSYSLLLIIIGVFVIVRIGAVLELKKKRVMRMITAFDLNTDIETEHQQKSALIRYASVKRLFTMMQSFIKFAVMWSWKDCLSAFITTIFGSMSENSQWTYFCIVTALVSVANAHSEQFICLYPKYLQTEQAEQQERFLKGAARKQVGLVIDASMQMLVVLALLDALVTTLQKLSNNDSADLCALYWVTFVACSAISLLGTYYATKWSLRYVFCLSLSVSIPL